MEKPRQTRRRRWTGIALVVVICVVGLAGSAAATAAVQRAEHRHAGQLMDQYAEEVSRAVAGEADRYSDTLSDMAAGVGAQSNFTAKDFTEITSRLSRQRLPGAASVAFAVASGKDQILRVQATWRAQGASRLTLAAVGDGDEHLFVIFSRALDTTAAPPPGRDLGQTSDPADALRVSRATGQVAASHTYVLRKDRVLPASQQQMSFMLAAPVVGGLGTPDKGQFRGWMVMQIRGGDLIDETLLSQSRGAVAVTLLDLSASTPTIVAQPSTGALRKAGPLSRERTVIVGQRRWQLRLQPTGELLVSADQRMPEVVLCLCLLTTLFMAAMAGARNRAMDKVDHATAALRADIGRRERVEVQLFEREDELRHLAMHDPLTGLANRTLFQERVDHAIAGPGRSTLAVIFIDLDGFKQVNDKFGHGAGDGVLVEVAVRLQDCVRVDDTVARFGGDEFAVLADHVRTVDDATIIADRIIRALQVPFEVDGRDHHVTASAGVAIHEHGTSADATIRAADEAMYSAKAAGKNHYALADPNIAGDAAALL